MSLDLVRKLLKENLEDVMFESLLDEEYPTNFNMEEFKKMTSFNQRIKYCQANLKRISSGSSRIVYQVDDTKVLKLARNKKGIAQNEAEAHWMNDYYFEDILAKIIDAHPQDLWNEMELARKVTPAIWKQHFGYDIETIVKYLNHRCAINNGRRSIFGDVPPEIAEVLHENSDVQSIYEFADSSGIKHLNYTIGDLAKLNSYGLVKRNGKDTIVIIDFGLNSDVWESYYS